MSAATAASSSPPRRLLRTALGVPRLTRLTRVNLFLHRQTTSRQEEVNPSPVHPHLSSSSISSSSCCPCCCIERRLVSSFASSPSSSLSSLCICPHTISLSSSSSSSSLSCLSCPPPHRPVSSISLSSSPSSASLLLSSSPVPTRSSSAVSTPPCSLPSPVYRSTRRLSSSSSQSCYERSSSPSLFLSAKNVDSLPGSRGVFLYPPRKKRGFSLLSRPRKSLLQPVRSPSQSRRYLSSSSSCSDPSSSFSLVSPLSPSHSSSSFFLSPSVLSSPPSQLNSPSTPSSSPVFPSSLPLSLSLLQVSQSHVSLSSSSLFSSSSSLLLSSPWSLSSRCFSSRPGATKMKWYFQKKYIRRVPSDYFRYPAISRITRQKIDWLYRHPRSGYEGADLYGPNTIEVTNLPMGKTPEYLQERLWRYFGKFGIVERVRVLPHELDPYQTNGTAFVSFRR